MNYRNPELGSQGFRCLAGPYSSKELWMIDTVIEDATKAGKETRIAHNDEGAWVWQRPLPQ